MFINNEVVDVKKKIVKGSIILVCVEDIFLNIVSDNRKKNALTELSRPLSWLFFVSYLLLSLRQNILRLLLLQQIWYANWSGWLARSTHKKIRSAVRLGGHNFL